MPRANSYNFPTSRLLLLVQYMHMFIKFPWLLTMVWLWYCMVPLIFLTIWNVMIQYSIYWMVCSDMINNESTPPWSMHVWIILAFLCVKLYVTVFSMMPYFLWITSFMHSNKISIVTISASSTLVISYWAFVFFW